MNKKAIIILYIALYGFTSFGQNKFTVSGYIMDEASGEKLIQANVFDSNSLSGTVSNLYGFYSITLPEDSVNLSFSYIGYQAQEKHISLGKDITLNIQLAPSLELEEVSVSARRSNRIEEESLMGVIDIPVKLMKTLPSFLGEADILKAIQLLPGVQSGSEGQSGFYVRGGSPDQNLILLDGVPVYNASHLFGFFSVFNSDAISDVKLIKGGYPARYGGRLSSVLDIRMKEGNKNEYHGSASIGLISSKFTFEGPVIKDKTSFIVSGRRTYADILARPFIKRSFSKGGGEGVAGYFFHDLNAKINHSFSHKDRLYLSMYTGKDLFYLNNKSKSGDYSSTEANDLHWGNLITAARWNHVWTGKLFSNTSFTYSKYNLGTAISYKSENIDEKKVQESSKMDYASGINDLAMNLDFDYLPNPNHFVRFGAKGIYHQFNPGKFDMEFLSGEEQSNIDTVLAQKQIEAYEFALYLEDDYRITKKLKANIGAHFSGFMINNKQYYSLQPRLSVRYMLPGNIALKASYAQMRQYIQLLAFSSIGLPTDLWLPTTEKVKPQDSWQAAVGLATTLYDKFEISIEGYYKEMNNVISYKEGAGLFQFDDWQERITQGKGQAYGMELFINKTSGRWKGWFGYTLSWSWRQFDDLNFGKKYHYKYDRRHDISIVSSYEISDRVHFSGTWVYGTGNAITLANSSYYGFFPSDVGSQMQLGTKHFAEKNNFRMNPYHRLDLGFDFIKKKRRYTRKWSVGAYNAYSRKNPLYLKISEEFVSENDIQKIEKKLVQVSLFPVIPYLSYSIDF